MKRPSLGVFGFFLAAGPPARALGCPRIGGWGHVAGRIGGRRDPARAQAREASGDGPGLRSLPRPGGRIINSAPGSGCGSRAPATCAPLLRGAQATRALPPQRRTQASLDSAMVHQWPITGLDFLTCKLGMSHLALHGEFQIKVLLAVCLNLGKTLSLYGTFHL